MTCGRTNHPYPLIYVFTERDAMTAETAHLPPNTRLHITWDDEQGNPGWYVEVTQDGPTMADEIRTVTDSMKVDFPVNVDRFGRKDVRALVAALTQHWPHAIIVGVAMDLQ